MTSSMAALVQLLERLLERLLLERLLLERLLLERLLELQVLRGCSGACCVRMRFRCAACCTAKGRGPTRKH